MIKSADIFLPTKDVLSVVIGVNYCHSIKVMEHDGEITLQVSYWNKEVQPSVCWHHTYCKIPFIINEL